MKLIKTIISALVLMALSGAFLHCSEDAKGIHWLSMRDAMARSKSENKKIMGIFTLIGAEPVK